MGIKIRVPGNHERKDTKRCSRAPVHNWVAEKEIFDRLVIPAAHSQADVENGPLPELGREIILLVRIWNERIVGCHHGNVQVDKIT